MRPDRVREIEAMSVHRSPRRSELAELFAIIDRLQARAEMAERERDEAREALRKGAK